MITRAPIVDSKLNLKMNQKSLNRVYLDHQCDTFRTGNTLVYHILSKIFPDKGDYIVMKKRKSMQDGSAVFFDIHKLFLARTMWPDRQQQQKESCKPLTMVVRGKGGIVTSTSHSTNNSMPLWRTTQIMATVRLIKASNLPLSSRHQEH